MASEILATPTRVVTHTHQYRLPPADRQAILAESDSAKALLEVERQRIAFATRNGGCSFGQAIFKSNKSR